MADRVEGIRKEARKSKNIYIMERRGFNFIKMKERLSLICIKLIMIEECFGD